MSRFELYLKQHLEGTFGKWLFPVGMCFLGMFSTLTLFFFLVCPGLIHSHSVLIVMAVIAGALSSIGGCLGMIHYRKLGFYDALRRKSG